MKSILNNTIQFNPLKDSKSLSTKNLHQISQLIFDTDKYISAALFEDKDSAKVLISEMIQRNDNMFNTNNLFVAQRGNDVVGIILWHRGSLNWTSTLLETVANKNGIKLTKHLDKVKREYFSSYDCIPDNVVSIIDVCVDNELRGQKIGNRMLSSFLEFVDDNYSYELHVLEDNKSAIKLYKNMGFQVEEQINGFSIDDLALPCFKMIKRKN